MKPVHDISPAAGLKPKMTFIPEIGEQCINMDGVIELARQIDTPQAKAIYRAFRRRHAQIRLSRPDLTATKQRSEAILSALADCGVRVTMKPVGPGAA